MEVLLDPDAGSPKFHTQELIAPAPFVWLISVKVTVAPKQVFWVKLKFAVGPAVIETA